MPQNGQNLNLSVSRQLIADVMHFAQKVPTAPLQRRMNLHNIVETRKRTIAQTGWCAIFTKAFALAAKNHPELRQAYLSFPSPHLYQHPTSVASIAVERQFYGHHAVLFAQVRAPESQSLVEIEAHLRRYKERPIEEIRSFTRALEMGNWPRSLRRLRWWMGLNLSGVKRAHYLGTFGVTVYAGLGASSLHPLSPLTSTVNYGVVQPDGSVEVRLIYDCRVLDGSKVAHFLADWEFVLTGTIAEELKAGA